MWLLASPICTCQEILKLCVGGYCFKIGLHLCVVNTQNKSAANSMELVFHSKLKGRVVVAVVVVKLYFNTVNPFRRKNYTNNIKKR